MQKFPILLHLPRQHNQALSVKGRFTLQSCLEQHVDCFSINVSIIYTTNFGRPIDVFRLNGTLITNMAHLTMAPFKNNPAVIVMKINIRGLKHGGCKSKQKLGTLLVAVCEKTTEFAGHKI